MFEKYQFDSCYIAVQAVLTLYAQGKEYLILAPYLGRILF